LENKTGKYPPIEELIPHRKPILCIDEVISIEGLEAKTQYKIEETCLFYTDGIFSELGLLENTAQSSFVFLKYFFADQHENMWGEGKDSVGFISHITQMETYELPQLNDQLVTKTNTELVYDTEELKICNVKAEVEVNEKLYFQTEMKMILQTRNL
jgi:predicted hotdog family 3-hydroxylacyl-ACP dehydratase